MYFSAHKEREQNLKTTITSICVWLFANPVTRQLAGQKIIKNPLCNQKEVSSFWTENVLAKQVLVQGNPPHTRQYAPG